MEVECSIIDSVEWTCIKPKQETFVRATFVDNKQNGLLLFCRSFNVQRGVPLGVY